MFTITINTFIIVTSINEASIVKNEFYQYKLDEREIQLNDLRNRLKGLIDDNNELFTQNRKLKYLIESNNNF